MPPGRCCSPAASHGPVKWADSSGGEKNRGEEGRQLPAKGEPHPWGAAARAITRACRPPPPPAPFYMEGVNAVYHPAEAGWVGGWLDYAPLRVTLPPSWPPSQGVAATMGRKTTGGGHGEGSHKAAVRHGHASMGGDTPTGTQAGGRRCPMQRQMRDDPQRQAKPPSAEEGKAHRCGRVGRWGGRGGDHGQTRTKGVSFDLGLAAPTEDPWKT